MRDASVPRLKHLVLLLAKSLGVFSLARRLTRRKVRILCYHGGCIGDEGRFNPKLFNSKILVEGRLTWLRQHGFTPVALADAVNSLSKRQCLGPLPTVITVDDGWFSSREHIVLPAIEAAFPVTLYLATEGMLKQTPVLDVTLSYVFWKAGAKETRLIGLPGVRDDLYDLRDKSVRESLIETLVEALRETLTQGGDVRLMLEKIATALGVAPEAIGLESRRFSYLDANELVQLQQQGCDIQLHGHKHTYVLGHPELVRRDVLECRDAIRVLGLPNPEHYCYPSGVFDDDAPTTLASIGVRSATTCTPGLVDPLSQQSCYLLPRFLDGNDVSMLEFEAEMSGVLDFARALRGRARARN